MNTRTALPWLLTLEYSAYWRSNYGDFIKEVPLFRLRHRLRETASGRLEPTRSLW